MRKIVFLPVAARDLEDVVDYLAQFYDSRIIFHFS